MKKLALGALLCGAIFHAACGGGSETPDARELPGPPDAGDDDDDDDDDDVTPGACNPVAQTGCAVGEKCTWLDETAELGRVACVPDGTAALGTACTSGEPGPTTGFDTCVAGGYCIAGICQEICTDAPDSCAEGSSCTTYSGLFDASTGACDFNCNPVTQERLTDNAPACGSPNPEDPVRGCYGQPNSSFSCKPAGDPKLVHGSDATYPDGNVYGNGCAPGNFVAQFYGQDFPTCTAYCEPAPSFDGNMGQANGTEAHSCAAAGAPAAECRYWWSLETAPTVDEDYVGYCYEYTGLFIDADGDGVLDPGEEAPSCGEFTETQDDDADGYPDYIQAGCGPYPPRKMAATSSESRIKMKLAPGAAEQAKAYLSTH